MLILARCEVCMVKSCSSMLCWQPSGFSTHTNTRVCLKSFRCLYEGGGIFLEQGRPAGPVDTSEHTGNERTDAWGTAGCLMHRPQRLIPAVKGIEFQLFKKRLHFDHSSLFCFEFKVTPMFAKSCRLPTMLTHGNKSPQCTALHLQIQNPLTQKY